MCGRNKFKNYYSIKNSSHIESACVKAGNFVDKVARVNTNQCLASSVGRSYEYLKRNIIIL